MPKVGRRKKAPEGWQDIEPTIAELDKRLREVEAADHEGKRVAESTWPIFRLAHQKSRYIYDLYYKQQAISKELYEWCLDERIADRLLIAKWKKPGYENLCCLRCIQPKDTSFGSLCICRVPKDQLDPEKKVECVNCGCKGCSGH